MRTAAGGTVAASEFVFPFADASFDFVSLTSVFTHMLPVDLEHYAGQIARVLRPEGHYIADPANPELAVAFDELTVREFLQRHGLHVQNPIHFRGWSGRQSHLSFQDIVLARKT